MARVVAVHGFGFDPASDGGDHPFFFFRDMSVALGQEVDEWAWYSAPTGFRHVLRAWKAGYIHRYRHAWALALKEAQRLALWLDAQARPVDIVCHSLGSRVVLQALGLVEPGRVGRVLILNGAELIENLPARLHAQSVLNVAVETDNVLSDLGARFVPGRGRCVGQEGLGSGYGNARTVFLDEARVQQACRTRYGWDLHGDNPDSLLDHWYSYRFKGNWPLFRAYLAGDFFGV